LPEPDAGKLARPVLRGPRRSNASGLPDGSRSTGPDAERPARHLLAVIDQHTRVVLGQVSIDTRVEGKTSEISRFAPLLDTLTALDLTDVVITADALCRARHKASYEDVTVMPMCCRGCCWWRRPGR